MRLHIVGPGVVGLSTGRGFARFGHSVVYSDKGDNHAIEADLHLVCVPEDAVPEVVQQLAQPRPQFHEYNRVVIRSSVPPGTTLALARKYPHLKLWHNPEFLREAVAESDFLHTERAIIGWASPAGQGCLLEDLYRDMLVPVYHCSSTASEMVKLVTNSYLATQLGFWQEVKRLCEAQALNSHRVGALVALDPRVSSYGPRMHGTSYGHTKCLPKDLAQLTDLGNRLGVDTLLLQAVRMTDLMTVAREKQAQEKE